MKALTELSPNFTDMDPYVIKLLLKEASSKNGVLEEESDEEEV